MRKLSSVTQDREIAKDGTFKVEKNVSVKNQRGVFEKASEKNRIVPKKYTKGEYFSLPL